MSSTVDTSSFNNDNAKDCMGGSELLVGFPTEQGNASPMMMGGRSNNNAIGSTSGTSCSGGKAKQRNSISINPMAMRGALAGLADLDDSDDEDDKQKNSANNNQKKVPSPPSQPQVSNPKASGGPEHRPLVGGFAAAAYEAARVDYYKKQGMNVKGHHPPRQHRPWSHLYPKYP